MDNLEIVFHYKPSLANPGQYEHLSSLLNPLDQLEYITTKAPCVGTWSRPDTKQVLYSPMIGDVHLSLSRDFLKYVTPTGAYLQACRIKAMMVARMKFLKQAYEKRPANLKIINEHFLGRGISV